MTKLNASEAMGELLFDVEGCTEGKQRSKREAEVCLFRVAGSARVGGTAGGGQGDVVGTASGCAWKGPEMLGKALMRCRL